MTDIRPLKQQLRAYYSAVRQKIPPSEKQKRDESITNGFIRLPIFAQCDMILLYASVRAEISTGRLLELCLRMGKQVALPRCAQGRRMDYFTIRTPEELHPGAFGIPEPAADPKNRVQCFDHALCVVPALSFDRYGYRLGYGGGYYDRFLARFSGETIGFCYQDCIHEEMLPHGKYDRRLPAFLTEQGVVICE